MFPALGTSKSQAKWMYVQNLTQMHKNTRIELVYWMAHLLAV